MHIGGVVDVSGDIIAKGGLEPICRGLECQAEGFSAHRGVSQATVTMAINEEGDIRILEKRQNEGQILRILLASW